MSTAQERLLRRDYLKTELNDKHNRDLRYDSRLCLNYINKIGKVLSIAEIAKELNEMDRLYATTSYQEMMGRLLKRHWRHCKDKRNRFLISDDFSTYCKTLIEQDREAEMQLCSLHFCSLKE